MSYDQDTVVGSRAVNFLLARINDSQRFRAVSVENSFLDTMHGIDYFILNLQALEMYTGSHRHVKNQYKDSALLRYSRVTGALTDIDKLQNKPDNHWYSFSFGLISYSMPIYVVKASSFKRWLDSHKDSLSKFLIKPYGDSDNVFLQIPFNDLEVQDLNSITN